MAKKETKHGGVRKSSGRPSKYGGRSYTISLQASDAIRDVLDQVAAEMSEKEGRTISRNEAAIRLLAKAEPRIKKLVK